MARYIGNYEILQELGAGFFGTVYAAVGELPGRGLSAGKRRLVAVKQLKDGADERSLDLLVQEFQLLDQVKHRGIVRVYDYMPDDRAVVMEYIHGVTLRKMLDELDAAREQVFTEAAVEICCELADALYQAWTTPGDNGEPLRLVHRDLKPENIMLTPRGEVKVLDFGLARVDNADFRKDDPDRIKGTPLYMAPEQARGREVDHRTDLFAVGLIAYELLMNRPAYRVVEHAADPIGATFDAIERGALLDECRELESKLPGLGPILARLLQANPRNRYQDGHGLLVELRRQIYRERGASLREFCEFFFEGLYDLPAAPDPSRASGRPPSASRSPSNRSAAGPSRASARQSFEERVRQSVAQQSGGASAAAPSGRAQRFTPDQGGAARRRRPQEVKRQKIIGARSADETGMMPIGGLVDEEPESAPNKDPNATAFFAIKPNESSAPPPPPSLNTSGLAASGSHSTPVQAQLSASGLHGQQPVQRPGVVPPASGYVQPLTQGPVAAGPLATGPVASGPVASGPVAAAPFAGAQPEPQPVASSGNRVQSNRVYAAVLGMMALAGIAIGVIIWSQKNGEAPAAEPEPTVAVAEPESEPEPEGNEDTGAALPPPAPVTTSSSSSGGSSSSSSSGGSSSSSSSGGSSAPPAPPAGQLTIKIASGFATQIDLNCGGSSLGRKSISGGAVVFSDVPSASCKASFKGGDPGSVNISAGTSSLTCNFAGTWSCS